MSDDDGKGMEMKVLIKEFIKNCYLLVLKLPKNMDKNYFSDDEEFEKRIFVNYISHNTHVYLIFNKEKLKEYNSLDKFEWGTELNREYNSVSSSSTSSRRQYRRNSYGDLPNNGYASYHQRDLDRRKYRESRSVSRNRRRYKSRSLSRERYYVSSRRSKSRGKHKSRSRSRGRKHKSRSREKKRSGHSSRNIRSKDRSNRSRSKKKKI